MGVPIFGASIYAPCKGALLYSLLRVVRPAEFHSQSAKQFTDRERLRRLRSVKGLRPCARRRKLRIIRIAASGNARSLRCSSSSPVYLPAASLYN